jgi:hypothetical protein
LGLPVAGGVVIAAACPVNVAVVGVVGFGEPDFELLEQPAIAPTSTTSADESSRRRAGGLLDIKAHATRRISDRQVAHGAPAAIATPSLQATGKIDTIFEGASEIQRLVVARAISGLRIS